MLPDPEVPRSAARIQQGALGPLRVLHGCAPRASLCDSGGADACSVTFGIFMSRVPFIEVTTPQRRERGQHPARTPGPQE